MYGIPLVGGVILRIRQVDFVEQQDTCFRLACMLLPSIPLGQAAEYGLGGAVYGGSSLIASERKHAEQVRTCDVTACMPTCTWSTCTRPTGCPCVPTASPRANSTGTHSHTCPVLAFALTSVPCTRCAGGGMDRGRSSARSMAPMLPPHPAAKVRAAGGLSALGPCH
jgi:hypothetical protein